MSDEGKAAMNTDRELWREREGDFYASSIHVTQAGGVGINVGGTVIVKPLADWHALATPQVPPEDREGEARRIARVRAVGEGRTINGTYKLMPGEALAAFREDLLYLTAALQTPPAKGEVERLRELSEKATAGPWLQGTGGGGGATTYVYEDDGTGQQCSAIASCCLDLVYRSYDERVANAAFIVACVNYVRSSKGGENADP